MKTLPFLFIFLFFCPQHGFAKVKTKKIFYASDSLKHVGFLAWNSGKKSKRVGILLLPEWWGLNDDIKNKAKKLAKMGYTVLAADLYGSGKKTNNPKEAEKLLSALEGKKNNIARQSFMAAYLTLKRQKNVQSDKIALIGYGFGGALATDMSRRGIDAKALVNFYGPVKTTVKIKPGSIRSEVLWIKGEDDAWIEKSMEEDFKKEMDGASVKYRIITYPKTFHSFTNPQATKIGEKHRFFVKYSPDASKRSWLEMIHFLNRIFK